MRIKNKHSGSNITIFSEMTFLANQNQAVNLSQGFPDYEIKPLLKRFLADGTNLNYNQYAPSFGLPILLENLIRFNSERENPLLFSEKEITITPGATYGIYTALAAILQPNDEVIVLEPNYDSYIPAIESNFGKAIPISLGENFEPDFEKISEAITEKTTAIIINSPHNPTGKIWKKEDWEFLYQIIKDKNILVISDEVYDLICFDDHKFYSAFHHPELKKRCFSVFSFGKMFHITGWKVGYILASEELIKSFRRIHQYLSFSVNTPAQYALAKYLEVFDAAENLKFLQNKRDFFLESFKGLAFQISEKSEGSYFQLMNFKSINSEMSDKEFAIWLTKNYKVASIPLSAFYSSQKDTGNIRFCFTKKEETILQAVENLKKINL